MTLKSIGVPFVLSLISICAAHAEQDAGARLLEEQRQNSIRQRMEKGAPGAELEALGENSSVQSEACFEITRIDISGVTKLRPRELNSIVEPLKITCVGQREIEHLMASISRQYKSRGYITAQTFIPEQDLTKGTLTLIVVEGQIEAVQHVIVVSDGKQIAAPHRKTEGAFPGLKGSVIQLRAIEQGVSQINSNGVSQTAVEIAPGKLPGGSVIRINEKQGRRSHAQIRFETSKQRSGDSEKRATLQFTAADLTRLNERWALSYSGATNSNAFASSVNLPYGYWTFGLNGSLSDQLDIISPIVDNISQATSAGISVDRVVYRDANYILHANFSGNHYASERYINATALSPQRDISGRFGGALEAYLTNAQIYADVGATFGQAVVLAGSDTTREEYCKLDASFLATVGLGDAAMLQASVAGQVSGENLPSDQQFSAGGWGTVRGFPEYGISGDSGASAKIELQRALPFLEALARSAKPAVARSDQSLFGYVFVDAGAAYANQTKQPAYLISTGFGLRLTQGRASIDGYVAVPFDYSGNVSHGVSGRISMTINMW
ncbi:MULTISPECIES: ShlB/FhaC/HecB family hemolysin secretion/activation protein [Mesorhizobium]|uniref:ShlB/FhaC/HecB family hemolysin secretion/activation protein n=1 Tax=Mesorhizobium denitrificans TaxID=2294114 RepID=A0A371X1X7_9HYPH|nr:MULTISPECIES: ShlB/FhaC/HecB family hemolysin secretion/activation protein [Mesorhizobium]RFC63235.1 ShlB/FhaC/HecB family hemolysin secretion/activation protein [Mesorhizobium denitrificans]